MAEVQTQQETTPTKMSGFKMPTFSTARLRKIIGNIITPYAHVTQFQQNVVIWGWVVVFILGWYFNTIPFIPSMTSVFEEIAELTKNSDLIGEFMTSLGLCLTSLVSGTILSAIITYTFPIALLKPLAQATTKLRYLSISGLTFFFTLLSTADNLKTYLLVFSMTVFFVTSFIPLIIIDRGDYLKNRVLGISKWRTLWEEVIVGRRDKLIETMAQTFAILWMMLPSVELLVRSSGGIGVLLSVEARYLHLNGVVGIALLVVTIGIALDAAFGVLKLWIAPYTKYEAKN